MKCAECNSFIFEARKHCRVCRARQNRSLEKLTMSFLDHEVFDDWYKIMIGPIFNMPPKEAKREALSLAREYKKFVRNQLFGVEIGDER